MGRDGRIITNSAEETIAFGERLGSQLKPNDVLCFFGDLGAGKTTFIKGIVLGATGLAPEEVTSPTFAYLNIYGNTPTVYHFDLYRLNSLDEFVSSGFEEYLFAGGMACIEWSEKIAPILPKHAIKLFLFHESETTRRIEIFDYEMLES